MESVEQLSTGRAAFAYPDFLFYQSARFLIVLATVMQSVAVGWQVYELTHRPLDLGFVGLAQFLPGVLLFLVAGHSADRYDRRKLLTACYGGFAACSALLFMISYRQIRSVGLIYLVLVGVGIVRSFNWPVSRAILPQLVPEEAFANAVAWNSGLLQAAVICGPALGGLLYTAFRGASAVYMMAALVAIVAMILTVSISLRPATRVREPMTRRTVLAGFDYIWRNKLILGSISLDLFAVLLGGAVALLPVYAKEILRTGAWGLGILRSAPGMGAGLMAIFLAHHPSRGRTGPTMLWAVAGFGVFTIIFGLSHNFMISVVALVLLGASDMLSVIIRALLVQLGTPDEMRGRVNAVDMLFIGASNELGEFESGLTAHWFGTVPAVVLGGIGTLVVIALWAWLFPELRSADKMPELSRS